MARRTETAAPKSRIAPSFGVMFELENVATHGHRLAYSTLEHALKERGAAMNPGLYVRYVAGRPPSQYLPALLEATGKGRLSADRFSTDIREKLAAAFTSPKLALENGLGLLLKAVTARGGSLGALSGLPQEAAQALCGRVGLTAYPLQLICQPSWNEVFPTSDGWRRLAAQMGVAPTRCLAIVTTAWSCRAALCAGCRVVGLPGELLAAQDFGGTDSVVERLDERLLKEFLSSLPGGAAS